MTQRKIGHRAPIRKLVSKVAGTALAIIGAAGMPDDLKAWGELLKTLDAWLDNWSVRASLTLVGIAILTYPQWLPTVGGYVGAILRHGRATEPVSVVPRETVPSNVNRIRKLITQLDALGDQLEGETETGRPPSLALSRSVIQTTRDLQALSIPHPNWHGLDEMPVLAWLGYVDVLLPALRRPNLREARDAINHIDMARGLKP